MKLRTVVQNDIEELSEFLYEGFPSKSPAKWRLRFNSWWLKNPAMTPSIPWGWILEENDSKIVGFLGNIPFTYQIFGEKGLAVASTSWYVKSSVQGLNSIKLLLPFLKQKEFGLFLSTTPSNKVSRMQKPTGFTRIILPYNQIGYWYILDYYEFILQFFKKKIKSEIIIKFSSFITKPLIPLSHFHRRNNAKKWLNSNNIYNCTVCNKCDEQFTEFWKRNRKSDETTLFRDAETLNWLYFSDSVSDKRLVIKCIEQKSNDLVGYVVFDIHFIHDRFGKYLRLMDLYIPNINENIIMSLFSCLVKIANDQKISAILFWTQNEDMNKLMKKRMRIKKRLNFEYYYKFNIKQVEDLIKIPSHEFIASPIDPDRGIV